ncbi:hypothetical protein ACP4OV_022454 [Aristida adscensionis]
MRAITGAVVSSRPCPLRKAADILDKFSNSAAASDLPSSDCAAYLRVAAEAVAEHFNFRRDLRRSLAARGSEGPDGAEEQPRHRLGRDGGDAAPVLAYRSAAEAGLAAGGGGEKSKKKKKIKEEDRWDGLSHLTAVAGVASPEIAAERRKKKERHSSIVVKQEPDVVAEEEMGSEKKKDKKKKKKEKDHVKVEEQATAPMEVDQHIINNGTAGEGMASGEKKRKKKKHAEEEGNVKGVEKKGNLVVGGDLGSEKKREKKRGRGDNDDNALEQVKHTKKKQRKQS